MRWVVAFLTGIALILGSAHVQAETERRVALVIGNSTYKYLPQLDNPINDAQLIASTLKGLGFSLIGGREQTDLDRAGFELAVREFGAKLAGGAVGLFYYAGHGVQVQGVNYLIPVGANPTSAADADFELIDAGLVLKQMEAAGSKLNIVILDACRNNPFGGHGLRDAAGGLAQMRAPEGTLISYATQPGNVAMDGTSGHSPYTLALADEMRRPGVGVLEVFNAVGLVVGKSTFGRQQPWVAHSPIAGNFYFLTPATVTVQPTPPGDAELLFWQTIMSSGTAADFEEYLRQYPQGRFAGLARIRITGLKREAFDPEKIPFIKDKNKDAARKYIDAPTEKAFAISASGNGYFEYYFGIRSTAEAQRRALEACEFMARFPCFLYATNNEVEPAPDGHYRARPTLGPGDGAFDPANVPFVSDVMRRSFEGYASAQGFKALAVSPSGFGYAATSSVSAADAQRLALERCSDVVKTSNSLSKYPCYLYAVSDSVVFFRRATAPDLTIK